MARARQVRSARKRAGFNSTRIDGSGRALVAGRRQPPIILAFLGTGAHRRVTLKRIPNLNLVSAFEKFGARPTNRLRGLSAIAADGALVLSCSHAFFGHPTRGVLRYEDKLSRESTQSKDVTLLGEHLSLARDGTLPVRLVVHSPANVARAGKSPGFHARPDLVGKLIKFDGDHFIVDFTRLELAPQVAGKRK